MRFFEQLETVIKYTHFQERGIFMLKVINEDTEEEMIKKEDTDLEGEFYYMSTRYKSLIPLINEVKAQRGELQQLKSAINNVDDKVEKVDQFTNVKDLASAYGVLIDKEFKFAEMQSLKKETEKPLIFIPAKDMGKAFVDLYRDIKERKHDDYWLEGGRGSIKSSFWSEVVPEELENNPNWCAICIRKVANTLKDSVYIIDSYTADNKYFPIQTEIIKPIYKIPELKLYGKLEDARKNIIFCISKI